MSQRVSRLGVFTKLFDFVKGVFRDLSFEVAEQDRLLVMQIFFCGVELLFQLLLLGLLLGFCAQDVIEQVVAADLLMEIVNLLCRCRHLLDKYK